MHEVGGGAYCERPYGGSGHTVAPLLIHALTAPSNAGISFTEGSQRERAFKGICVETYIHTPCKICGFHGGDYEEWRLSASFIRVTRIG
jgi:hypothetical protein